MDGPKCIMGTTPRTKTIRARSKVLLIYGFQHFAQSILDQLVLKTGQADGTLPLAPSVLGDIHPSDRLVAISLRTQPLVQVPEIRLQVLPVVRLGDTIHAYRCVLTLAVVGASQGIQVHQVCQRTKLGVRLALRAFRYLHEFR